MYFNTNVLSPVNVPDCNLPRGSSTQAVLLVASFRGRCRVIVLNFMAKLILTRGQVLMTKDQNIASNKMNHIHISQNFLLQYYNIVQCFLKLLWKYGNIWVFISLPVILHYNFDIRNQKTEMFVSSDFAFVLFVTLTKSNSCFQTLVFLIIVWKSWIRSSIRFS